MNWVFLRGLARESAHWGDFLENFQKQLDVSNLHCIDLPGCGEFHRINASCSVQKYADHVEAQMSKNRPPYTLVGLSLGGMVALELVGRQCEGLVRAVIINSSSASSPPWKRMQPRSLLLALSALLSPSPSRQEKQVLALVSNSFAQCPDTINQWIEIQKLRPVTKANILRMLIAGARFDLPKPNTFTPLLFLSSQGDRLVSEECSKVLAEYYHSDLRIHPAAGHDLPLDEPNWVIEQISDWLSLT